MNRDFFEAREMARAVRRVRFGAQKSLLGILAHLTLTYEHINGLSGYICCSHSWASLLLKVTSVKR